jgi:toluene monooxygenase system protein D
MSAGPVLINNGSAAAIVAALRELNSALEVRDRGAYLRVDAPGECRLTRAAVERHLGRAFRLPGDLELVMTSYRGRLIVDDDEARWIDGEPS